MHYEYGKQIISLEIKGLQQVQQLLDESFDRAVNAVLNCKGNVIVCGVGKPWFIAQKISATMASTGTLSFPMHPADALHGDIGRIKANDVVILLSNSGSSDEITQMIPVIKQFGAVLIAMTGNKNSPLGENSDIVLDIGKIEEACPLGLAPSSSSTALLALGDALALTVLKARNFSKEDYARFHPAGALGRKLLKVREIMRDISRTPVLSENDTPAEAIFVISKMRAGAGYVVNVNMQLLGIFTDGDLRRKLHEGTDFLNQPVAKILNRKPRFISPESLVGEALKIMKEFKIDELPVLDEAGKLLGHIDVQDLLALGLAL